MNKEKLVEELIKDIKKITKTSYKIFEKGILTHKEYEKLYTKTVTEEEKKLMKKNTRTSRGQPLVNKYFYNNFNRFREPCQNFDPGYQFILVNTFDLSKGYEKPLFTYGLIACSAILFSEGDKNYIYHTSKNSVDWNKDVVEELIGYGRNPGKIYIVLGQKFSTDILEKYLQTRNILCEKFIAPMNLNCFLGIDKGELLSANYPKDAYNFNFNPPDFKIDIMI